MKILLRVRRATAVLTSLALTQALLAPRAWAQVLSAAGEGGRAIAAAGAAEGAARPLAAGTAEAPLLNGVSATLAAPVFGGAAAAIESAAAAPAAAEPEILEAAPERLQFSYDGAEKAAPSAAEKIQAALDPRTLSAGRPLRQRGYAYASDERAGLRLRGTSDVLGLVVQHKQHAYVEAARHALLQRSAELAREIESRQSDADPVVVDVAVVGAGPHSAMFLANLRALRPDANVVVFEAGDSMGTFDKFGPSFRLNSVETEKGSGNPFRGVPVQIADMNRKGDEFVSADKPGGVTVLAHDFARSNIVFNSPAADIEEEPAHERWPAPFRVVTQGGQKVYARIPILATGMGAPNDQVGDAATQALIQRERQKSRDALAAGDYRFVPGIETVDDMLERGGKASRASKGAHQPLDAYAGQEHLVVGQGDGGKIGVEFLGAQAPNTRTRRGDWRLSQTWLGQPAKTIEEFKRLNPKKRRYFPTLEQVYASSQFKAVDGRLVSIREGASTGKNRFIATYRTADGRAQDLRTGHVVLALGYKSGMMRLVSKLGGGGARLEPVVDQLDYLQDKMGMIEAPVATQVVVGDKPYPIFAIGNGSGIDVGSGISEEEHSAAIGGYLDNLSARTQRAAALVAQMIPNRPSAGGLRTPWTAAAEPVAALMNARIGTRASKHEASLSLPFKMELGRMLVRETLSPGHYTIEVGVEDKGVVTIRSGDGHVSPLTGGERWPIRETSIDLCLKAASAAGVRRVTAQVEVRGDGIRSIESVGFER